jgi:uncharacterized protein (DUF433 family)
MPVRLLVQSLQRLGRDSVAVSRLSEAGNVVRNPRVLSGEPIMRGTRISVRSVVLAAREYGVPDGVLNAYPQLTSAAVEEALAFYATHTAEIDYYIKINLDED